MAIRLRVTSPKKFVQALYDNRSDPPRGRLITMSKEHVLFLTDDQVTRVLRPDQLVDGLRDAFASLSSGEASVPPRIGANTPKGALLAMPGFFPGVLAVKAVSVYPSNVPPLPTHHALIILFEAGTGEPVAIMAAERITAIRTAATTALATELLARDDAECLAVVGAGVQGRAHIEVLSSNRRFKRILLASRTFDRAAQIATEFPSVEVAESIEAAVRDADVVCACTSSLVPILHRRWLKPGTHINSIGFGGKEVADDVVASCRLFVESRIAFSAPPSGAGELANLDPESGTELGELILGQRGGRLDRDELTLYKSTGNAIEDLAAAALAYHNASEQGLGTWLAV